jgi:biopolymer transport protein ExbD
MFRKRRLLEKPPINMTPMIDVVFLLLTFFVMTFKIIVPEGDFNVQMSPMGQAQPSETNPDSVQIRLLAHADGSLSAILLNDENIEHFDLLRQRVSAISLTKPNLEVVLFSDEHLHYEHGINAITAINGEVHEGKIRKICNNIKFARQKKPDILPLGNE